MSQYQNKGVKCLTGVTDREYAANSTHNYSSVTQFNVTAISEKIEKTELLLDFIVIIFLNSDSLLIT
jgi:hypothetical protein